MTSDDIANLVEEECRLSMHIPLAQAISPFRITPFARRLRWPYSSEQMDFPCWIIADLGSQKPGLTLAYCESGHGKGGDRWGIVGVSDEDYRRDDSWFLRLEDAFIAAGGWSEPLPEHYEVR